jgi:hypothetical protein
VYIIETDNDHQVLPCQFLEEYMIIDFRIRPPYKSMAAMRHFGNAMVCPHGDPLQESMSSYARDFMPSAVRKSMPLFLQEMDTAGISHAVIMGRVTDRDPNSKHDNRDLLELAGQYPDRFFAVASIDPRESDYVEQAELALKSGFKGLSFDLGYISMYPDDARMLPLYDLCNQYGSLCALAASAVIGPDLTYSDPTPLGRVARQFPKASFYIPHGAWPHVEKAIGVATVCPNVYLAPDVYMSAPDMPFADAFVRAANSFLMRQILFSSSYPIRGLRQSVEEWKALPLTKQARLQTMFYNGARILGIQY